MCAYILIMNSYNHAYTNTSRVTFRATCTDKFLTNQPTDGAPAAVHDDREAGSTSSACSFSSLRAREKCASIAAVVQCPRRCAAPAALSPSPSHVSGRAPAPHFNYTDAKLATCVPTCIMAQNRAPLSVKCRDPGSGRKSPAKRHGTGACHDVFIQKFYY